jgi:hypothetical protein
MFGLCSRSTPEFGLGYTFWRPACGRQTWREEKKLAKTQRRKGRKKSLGDLPSAGRLGAFARAKKEDLRGGRGRYQNKLACQRQSVKENTPSFLLNGTLLSIFELNTCNPIFQLLI